MITQSHKHVYMRIHMQCTLFCLVNFTHRSVHAGQSTAPIEAASAFPGPGRENISQRDDGWICHVILLKLFLLPADTLLLSALSDMYQPAVSLWGQTIFKDGNISALALSALLYGPAASLKAISLFIHGLPALAAITPAGERERKGLTEATRKGPLCWL